jgi:hypothetical protein
VARTARIASSSRWLVPVLSALLAAGACGGSEEEPPAGDDAGGSGGAVADAGGSGGAGAQPPDDGSDPDDPHACSGPGQCLLVDAARACCVASCGEQTIAFFSAIHTAHAGTWHAGQVCAGCLEPCSDEDRQAFTRSTTGIIAVCNAGRCEPMDIRQSDVTACTASSGCRVRWGAGCCEDRTENRDILTAISDRTLLRELTCSDRFTACGAWPDLPEDVHAACGASGHCELVFDVPDGGPNADAAVLDAGRPGDASAADGSLSDASGPEP